MTTIYQRYEILHCHRNAKLYLILGISIASSFVGTFLCWHLSSYTEPRRQAWLEGVVLDQPSNATKQFTRRHHRTLATTSRLNVSLIDVDWKELTAEEKKAKASQLWELTMAEFFQSSPPVDFAFSIDTRIYFIHVGKAGGSSLYEKLGLQNFQLQKRNIVLNCHMEGRKTFDECLTQTMGESPTRLFRATVGHRHLAATRYTKQATRWLKNNGTNTLLFTVRNPTARAVSAFNFHYQVLETTGKLSKTPFYNCFGSIEELAQAGGDYNVWLSLSPKCQNLARGFLKGENSFPGRHMFASFSYYVGLAWVPNRAVAAVRTEYLAQDMRNLEQKLGGDPDKLGEFQKEAKSKTFTINSGLSPEGKRSVCCWIVEEIPVFEKIVMLSENFDHKEKVSYIRNSRQDCGIDVSTHGNDDSGILTFSWKKWHQETCPPHVPLKDWFNRLF